MLIQDKICLFHYNEPAEFCQTLQKPAETEAAQETQNQILAETAQFGNYKTLVETLPLIIWSLFLGPFLDSRPNATFIIFLISILGNCFSAVVNLILIYFYETSPYYLLIASSSFWFNGGMLSFGTAAGLYITANFSEKSRATQFVVLEIIMILGIAGSMFLSGQFLKNKNDGNLLRTYHFNYFFTLALEVISILLLIGLYITKSDKSVQKKSSIQTSETKPSSIKSLLNLDNARQTLHAFFRHRPNNGRLQIFLLCFIQFNQLAIASGLSNLMIQFSQKVYNFDPTTYSTVSAITQVFSMVMLAIASPIFIKWLKCSDSNLMLIAQVSNFLADLIRGTFLSPLALFISLPVGCLNGFGIVASKSKFSKIVPKNEAGKIFTLEALIEGLVPLGTSLIYSNIFSLSIRTYPGLIYHFSCALMILTVVALIIEKRYCPVTGSDEAKSDEEANEI